MAFPDRVRSRAILIGTTTYAHPKLHDLPAVENNLNDLRAILTDPRTGSFAPEHCTVIKDFSDDRVVVKKLRESALAAQDVLLVYYAGHGVLDQRQRDLYFALTDTDLDNAKISALAAEWVRDEIRESNANTKVFIVDSCYSGRLTEIMADDESLVMAAISVRGTYTMASSPANKVSIAPNGERYTAFSGELVRLLGDGVSTNSTELNLSQIFRLMNLRLSERGLPRPQQSASNTAEDLALVRNPGRAVGQIAAMLDRADGLVRGDPQRVVDLLSQLVEDAEHSLWSRHPLRIRCSDALTEARSALAKRQEAIRREREAREKVELDRKVHERVAHEAAVAQEKASAESSTLPQSAEPAAATPTIGGPIGAPPRLRPVRSDPVSIGILHTKRPIQERQNHPAAPQTQEQPPKIRRRARRRRPSGTTFFLIFVLLWGGGLLVVAALHHFGSSGATRPKSAPKVVLTSVMSLEVPASEQLTGYLPTQNQTEALPPGWAIDGTDLILKKNTTLEAEGSAGTQVRPALLEGKFLIAPWSDCVDPKTVLSITVTLETLSTGNGVFSRSVTPSAPLILPSGISSLTGATSIEVTIDQTAGPPCDSIVEWSNPSLRITS